MTCRRRGPATDATVVARFADTRSGTRERLRHLHGPPVHGSNTEPPGRTALFRSSPRPHQRRRPSRLQLPLASSPGLSQSPRKTYLPPRIRSGAARPPGRFSEGVFLRRLHLQHAMLFGQVERHGGDLLAAWLSFGIDRRLSELAATRHVGNDPSDARVGWLPASVQVGHGAVTGMHPGSRPSTAGWAFFVPRPALSGTSQDGPWAAMLGWL